ncbi:FUSC family protein [Caulobacter sp. 602-1]|uniref:FUSC family protein n=1 Tax=Caulobacter sp. 602-1 TaxID=2492472 RepID=UPI000F631FFC|nr:FUSC family protein [Caulobacter sp. 602-1]RRN63862.1 hypothetical protein EIK80_13925 [Caulobacter sp. 602-1]
MTSIVNPAPPLSLRGAWAALRPPNRQDALLAIKAMAAVTLALWTAFSLDLQNPYWSALTVFVLLAEPQAGAVRSRSLFRLAGTALGAASAILLSALLGDDPTVLLGGAIACILLASFAKNLDRTPRSYTWFTTALTVGVVTLEQVAARGAILETAMTRMAEIGLAVLATALVDSLIAPRAETPAFVAAMIDWRDRMAKVAADALATPAASAAPDLTILSRFDAAEAHLPYDVVAAPPQTRDLHTLHRATTWLAVELAAAGRWRAVPPSLRGAVRTFVQRTVTPAGQPPNDDHRTLALALAAPGAERLAAFVERWRRFCLVLEAVSQGVAPPKAAPGDGARLPRSLDFAVAALDTVPMAVGLAACVALWGLTGWVSGPSAIVFVFLSLSFSLGSPGARSTAVGVLAWIAIAAALALIYQLGLLPAARSFFALAALLSLAVLPLGLLAAMSPVGVVVLANFFAILALRNSHATNSAQTAEIAAGALVGCLIALAVVGLSPIDREHLRARRLDKAARRDLCGVAVAHRPPSLERLVALGVDRAVIRTGLPGAPPPGRALDSLWLTLDLAALRTVETKLPAETRALVADLRGAMAFELGDDFSPMLSRALAEETLTALADSPADLASATAAQALAALRGGLDDPPMVSHA